MNSFKGFHQDREQMKASAQQSATGRDPKLSTGREPTQEELKRGDYAKGKVSYMGLAINIENPVGSVRSGDGWSIEFTADYGELNDYIGADGDGIDVFIGDHTDSEKVFVVNQLKQGSKVILDEHKIILGAKSRGEAEALYYNHHTDDWPTQPFIETNIDDLKAWLILGDKRNMYPSTDSWERRVMNMQIRKMPEIMGK